LTIHTCSEDGVQQNSRPYPPELLRDGVRKGRSLIYCTVQTTAPLPNVHLKRVEIGITAADPRDLVAEGRRSCTPEEERRATRPNSPVILMLMKEAGVSIRKDADLTRIIWVICMGVNVNVSS